MKRYRHALSKAIYSVSDQPGVVRVEHGTLVGFFTAEGQWLSGDIVDVDQHMCGWVGGPGHDDIITKPYKSV